MSRINKASPRSGFTLVELLIIAPIALLVITGFIALMVTMVGEAIASRGRNAMTYDIQSALSTIDRDVRLSTEFLATSGTLPSPQGKSDDTSPFTSLSGDLVLGEIATNKNPIDPTRGFIHYDAPFSCGDPAKVYQNRIFFITVVYSVKNGSLWRRTYVPTVTGTSALCQQPWQVNTCAPGYPGAAAQCQANDSEILKNIKDFNVDYYINPEDGVPITPSAAPSASSISITIEAEQVTAGRTINATSTGRSTKLSSKEINLSPPDPPIVSASMADERTASFSWPGVPTASSYSVRYNINGGSWVTASESTSETIFKVPAKRGATVSAQVFARNTTGLSVDSTSNNGSVTLALVNQITDFNGWTLTGGATYNATTRELNFGPTGRAQSPKIKVDRPVSMWVGGDMFATAASAHTSLTPQAGYHVSIQYYATDGVTAVQNTAGYTGNGCARGFARNAWQPGLEGCFFWGGPDIMYVQFTYFGADGGYTSSDLKVRNPLLKATD